MYFLEYSLLTILWYIVMLPAQVLCLYVFHLFQKSTKQSLTVFRQKKQYDKLTSVMRTTTTDRYLYHNTAKYKNTVLHTCVDAN